MAPTVPQGRIEYVCDLFCGPATVMDRPEPVATTDFPSSIRTK